MIGTMLKNVGKRDTIRAVSMVTTLANHNIRRQSNEYSELEASSCYRHTRSAGKRVRASTQQGTIGFDFAADWMSLA